MRRSIAHFTTFVRGFLAEERGVTALIVSLFMVVLLLLTGFVVDFGRVFWAQRQLQASADAAALAGGWHVIDGTAVAAACTYGGQSPGGLCGVTGNNATAKLAVTMAATYPKVTCFTQFQATLPCSGSPAVNGVTVTEQATVPMYFLRIMGLNQMSLSATSKALEKGGSGQALNLMIILDTTGSMGGTDNKCGLGNNSTREQCALAGVEAVLQGLNPAIDYVGLMVFPGVGSSAETSNYSTCGKTMPSNDIQFYNNTPSYYITALGNSFASKTGTLKTTDPIVIATGGGGCSSGIPKSPPGGVSTYFAAAINAAQNTLTAFAQPHTQNVIVILTDGDQNSSSIQTSITGYITGTTLTVTACPNGCAASTTQLPGPLTVGEAITGSGVSAATNIVKQLTGTTGGTGTYQVTKSQNVGKSNQTVSMTAANSVTYNGSTYAQNTDECAQAVSAAQAAAAAGTWVYSIAYGAGTSGTCSTDSPAISACTELAHIASSPGAIPDATKFYSDDANGCSATNAGNNNSNLISLFQQFALSLTEPRLVPANTT